MRQIRQEKLEKALALLEAEFRAKLIVALRRCQQGQWGLFGQNDYMKREFYAKSGAEELDILGAEIDQIRKELGIFDPFPLHARLAETRGRHSANDLGEPKLASSWLQELEG